MMCLIREFHLQGLRSPKMRSLLFVNEQFSDKRNAANGTLWTDTNYCHEKTSPLVVTYPDNDPVTDKNA